MKRNLLLLISLFSLGFLRAQNSFSDDIESYPVDSYVGASSANWTVWSGAAGEGTQEDALVTNEVAHSGKNSIRLEAGSASSGPTDLVLPFGGEKNVGKFTYTMWMYITNESDAYFNFQAKAVIGTTWALDNYFTADGKFIANLGSNASGDLCNVDIDFEKWIKYTLVANLTNNEWEILLNDRSVAKFSNPNNTIASIDIFPLFGGAVGKGSKSLYYVDDVSYEFVPFVPRALDAGFSNLLLKNKFLAGLSSGGSVQVRNLGTTPITSLDLTCKVDNGAPITASVSSLNVAQLAFTNINLPAIPYKLGNSTVSCSITKVNGIADDDISNNDKASVITGIQAAANKVMVTEEATGTWCQWCPRGAVYLDSMTRTYPNHFVGIAVHNADPMTVPAYDGWIGTFPGFTGYPSIINDRNQLSDPLSVEADFYDHIVVPTPVILTNGATFDATTKELQVSVKGDFTEDISGDYRFNLVVTEDLVKFPGTGYKQSNIYAGGARGVMGGFEKLSNPVPASKMTYNHVARAILDGAQGLQGYLPNTIKKGSTYSILYTVTLADTFKSANIHLVGLLYGPSGEIVNATTATIAEAVANGLTFTSNPAISSKSIDLSPNPSNGLTNLELELTKATDVVLQIIDITGKEVVRKDYGKLNGNLVLPINTIGFENGAYLIKLNVGNQLTTKKLVVAHN